MRLVGVSACLLLATANAAAAEDGTASPETVRWFQATEQALMDALAPGEKAVWDRAMDPSCVLTTEEGEVLTRPQFLVSGSLGEWVFIIENGRADRLVNLRKFAVLVWTRIEAAG